MSIPNLIIIEIKRNNHSRYCRQGCGKETYRCIKQDVSAINNVCPKLVSNSIHTE